VIEVEPGIIRVTFDLPLGIDHVHCYLLRASSGAWTLVDTGLGTEDPERHWRPVLDALDAPVERIVVTHMHPDHVGGARDVAELTGAPVHQGREDHAQCVRVWGDGLSVEQMIGYWQSHGLPGDQAESIQRERAELGARVHFTDRVEPLAPGDELDGWRVEVLRGHADGHLVLVRDGVLIAGDTLLAGITPVIGLYPESRPDPLGDYLETLDRIEVLAPRVAYAGHRGRLLDPAARAREIRAHHEARLEAALSALRAAPATAYEVSLALFDAPLAPALRRFALAESLAHLEWLVRHDRARRVDGRYECD
jgi:glyoxylase-like metal-dependent hydrolase (beta-lactamase superfamily II)